MKFGSFYELQVPRPWDGEAELDVYQSVLDQIEFADELGYDYVWEVEHHFLEEYSHSPAPGVFLSAAARNTEQIRIGHGIRLTPPKYNHPARVAEMAAALDLVSEGRLELGTGESSSRQELDGFGVPFDERHEMWAETTEQIADMMAMEPYPGFDGKYFSMPARNVVPKPVQDPHPPMWVACSAPETIEVAARKGIGALVIRHDSPEHAGQLRDMYYETFKEECVPIGRTVNPNFTIVFPGFGVHPDEEEAYRRGYEGMAFFQHTLAEYYRDGEHMNGYTNLWKSFDPDPPPVGEDDDLPNLIGTPEQLREFVRRYEEHGIDQLSFLPCAGVNEHEHICESLELFAEEVMPEFHDREAERQREKAEELEPYIEEAMERKEFREPIDRDDLEVVKPYDRRFDEDDFRAAVEEGTSGTSDR